MILSFYASGIYNKNLSSILIAIIIRTSRFLEFNEPSGLTECLRLLNNVLDRAKTPDIEAAIHEDRSLESYIETWIEDDRIKDKKPVSDAQKKIEIIKGQSLY